MDSTSTCHCSNLKIIFEELSYKFCLIRKSAHSTTAFYAYQAPRGRGFASGGPTGMVGPGNIGGR